MFEIGTMIAREKEGLRLIGEAEAKVRHYENMLE
jgi:hypothetical protein